MNLHSAQLAQLFVRLGAVDTPEYDVLKVAISLPAASLVSDLLSVSGMYADSEKLQSVLTHPLSELSEYSTMRKVLKSKLNRLLRGESVAGNSPVSSNLHISYAPNLHHPTLEVEQEDSSKFWISPDLLQAIPAASPGAGWSLPPPSRRSLDASIRSQSNHARSSTPAKEVPQRMSLGIFASCFARGGGKACARDPVS
jgi:hypothetical protein